MVKSTGALFRAAARRSEIRIAFKNSWRFVSASRQARSRRARVSTAEASVAVESTTLRRLSVARFLPNAGASVEAASGDGDSACSAVDVFLGEGGGASTAATTKPSVSSAGSAIKRKPPNEPRSVSTIPKRRRRCSACVKKRSERPYFSAILRADVGRPDGRSSANSKTANAAHSARADGRAVSDGQNGTDVRVSIGAN